MDYDHPYDEHSQCAGDHDDGPRYLEDYDEPSGLTEYDGYNCGFHDQDYHGNQDNQDLDTDNGNGAVDCGGSWNSSDDNGGCLGDRLHDYGGRDCTGRDGGYVRYEGHGGDIQCSPAQGEDGCHRYRYPDCVEDGGYCDDGSCCEDGFDEVEDLEGNHQSNGDQESEDEEESGSCHHRVGGGPESATAVATATLGATSGHHPACANDGSWLGDAAGWAQLEEGKRLEMETETCDKAYLNSNRNGIGCK
jgi:hypothetical protein